MGAGHSASVPEQLAVYGEKELEALARLLREVDPDTRAGAELTLRVAKTIAARIGWRDNAWAEDPETFLRQMYGAQRAHLERQLLFGRRKVDKNADVQRV